MIHYPRVHIEFCTKCRWNLRAAWYLQELLSTFGNQLGEVALVPGDSGVFRVWIQANENAEDKLLWNRKTQGFPDSKELKQLVRDVIDPTRDLGHSDRKPHKEKEAGAETESESSKEKEPESKAEGANCTDCENGTCG